MQSGEFDFALTNFDDGDFELDYSTPRPEMRVSLSGPWFLTGPVGPCRQPVSSNHVLSKGPMLFLDQKLCVPSLNARCPQFLIVTKHHHRLPNRSSSGVAAFPVIHAIVVF